MRICYLNHDLDKGTGAGNFCLALMDSVRKIAPSYQLEVLTSQGALAGGWFRLVLNLPKIRAVLQKYDIVHALDGWPYGLMATLAAWGLGKKIMVTAIGTGAVQPLYQPVKKILLRWAYRQVDKVIAVSSNTKREILKVMPDLEIEVINHGVDYEKFQITNSKSQINSKIQNFKPYILSVGTLKKRKGYEYSIRAFAEIAAKFPELKYVIVGNGPEYQNLKSQISNLKLQDKVMFLGGIEENFLIELYRKAELFILLSQDSGKDIEGFGLVFLEAAACGLPVVATRDSGAQDAVLDGKNGILVESRDNQAAARAVIKIFSDPKIRASMSYNSLNFARNKNWYEVAKMYNNLYKNLLSSNTH